MSAGKHTPDSATDLLQYARIALTHYRLHMRDDANGKDYPFGIGVEKDIALFLGQDDPMRLNWQHSRAALALVERSE